MSGVRFSYAPQNGSLQLEGAFLLCDVSFGLRVKKCVWPGVSWGLDLAFLDAD